MGRQQDDRVGRQGRRLRPRYPGTGPRNGQIRIARSHFLAGDTTGLNGWRISGCGGGKTLLILGSKRPDDQQHRYRHRQDDKFQRQAQSPVIPETEASWSQDQGVVLMSDGRQEGA